MKLFKKLFTLMLLIGQVVYAQDESPEGSGMVMTYPSPNGNYLRVFPTESNVSQFDELLAETAYFSVRRKEVILVENGSIKEIPEDVAVKEIGKMQRVKNARQLEKAVGESAYNYFMVTKKFSSSEEVNTFLENEYNRDSLGIYTENQIEFSIAFGLAYLDEDVNEGTVYKYEVYRIGKDGQEEYWGVNNLTALYPNIELDKIEMLPDSIINTDSLVNFYWQVKFPVFQPGEEPDFISLSDTMSTNTRLRLDLINKQMLDSTLNKREVTTDYTGFKVYVSINNSPFAYKETTLSIPDSLSENFRVITQIKCLPEDVVRTYLIPEDFTYNVGKKSEEFIAVSSTNQSVELIYRLDGRDSTNSIILEWPPLPNKPYYTGIQISKSFGGNEAEIIAELPASASSYIDYEVYPPGEIFTYYAKPTFIPKQGLMQDRPAEVALSCNKFSKPLPPFNLEVYTTATLPTIRWEAIEDPAIFSYNVYRGLTPDNLEIIGNSKEGNFYTDSNYVFSSRSTYYFAVSAMNVLQDTSDFSNMVSYIPSGNADIFPPQFINYETVNDEVILEWPDVKQNDDFIAGYLLQVKTQFDDDYLTISDDIISQNSFVDTTYVRGQTFKYRIASISYRNDTSEFSDPYDVFLPLPSVQPIREVTLINQSEGIAVEWPAIDREDILYYEVIRRKATESDFKTITQVQKGTFDYLDKKVEEETIYVYDVVVVERDLRKSTPRADESLRRETPKTTN